jgi:Ion channel
VVLSPTVNLPARYSQVFRGSSPITFTVPAHRPLPRLDRVADRGSRAQRRGGARRVRAGADHVPPSRWRSLALSHIGLTFVALYGFVALAAPSAFTNLPPLQGDFAVAGNLIYFSFVTLTTTGYGDIAPLHPYARSLANVEAIIGQIYPATLLARLVTLELAHDRGP